MSDVLTRDSKSCLKTIVITQDRGREKPSLSLSPVSLVLLVTVLSIQSVVFLNINGENNEKMNLRNDFLVT